jgi:hypothetical protein
MQLEINTVGTGGSYIQWRLCASAVILAMAPMLTLSAEISGTVTDSAGAPLPKVPVCLQEAEVLQGCIKLRFSNRKGNYSFKGLKPGKSYSLSIFLDKSAAARKFEEYKTYVWTPRQLVAIQNKRDVVTLPAFEGTFGFSNFQRVVELGVSDFPELTQIDLAAGLVFLKVAFNPVGSPDLPPETIFLGAVNEPTKLRLEATVPLAVTGIDYQVFSASFSYTGRISLVD